jgi:tetratricopeptide (TPR) repeat protein
MHAENLSVAAAFGLSYADLTPGQRRLFRRLGLVPGPSFDAYAAAALDATSLNAARRGLEGLYDQHLLAEPAPGRYQLHDLLREHARALAAEDSPAESGDAAGRLLDYYLHISLAAGWHFGPCASAYRRRPPAHAPDVSALGLAGAWLEAERANLHAAADYAAACGRLQHAIAIPVAISGFLDARGHLDQSAALHQGALAAARLAGDRLGEADTLGELGVLQGETGDYPAAAATLDRVLALYGEAGDLPGQAHTLSQLGFFRLVAGDYPGAAASAQRALALARSADDRFAEAHALDAMGLVQQLTGDYRAAAATQRRALALYRDLGNLDGQAWALNCLGVVQQETGDYPAAAASQQQALALFDDIGNRLGQAEALNRLGELATRTANTPRARERHAQALAIARDIGAAPEEARALEGLGQAHLHDANSRQAAAHLAQALAIYQRIGAPAAQRVQQTLYNHKLASTTPEPRSAAPQTAKAISPHTPA